MKKIFTLSTLLLLLAATLLTTACGAATRQTEEAHSAALNEVATIDDSERTSAAAGLARTQAELRRAQSALRGLFAR